MTRIEEIKETVQIASSTEKESAIPPTPTMQKAHTTAKKELFNQNPFSQKLPGGPASLQLTAAEREAEQLHRAIGEQLQNPEREKSLELIDQTVQFAEKELQKESDERPEVVGEKEIQKLFYELNQLMEDPETDQSLILDKMYCLLILLRHTNERNDRKYALDKEPVIRQALKNLRSNYNTTGSLIVSCLSGGILIASGLMGVTAVVPGTSFGRSISNLSPSFSRFGSSDFGAVISKFAQGTQTLGQATGAFSQIPRETAESGRAQYQFEMDKERTRQKDQYDSAKTQEGAQQQTKRDRQQNNQARAEAARQMTRGG